MPTFESTVRECRLRAGLSQAGLSQEGLSRLLGVSRQTVVNIERGESEPRVFLALAIAGVLGVVVGDLFRRTGTRRESGGGGEYEVISREGF